MRGSEQVSEPQALDRLAEEIERTWHPPKGSPPTPGSPSGRIGTEIILDRILDQFLAEHGVEKLLEVLANHGVTDVRVIRVESGSIKLTLSLPEDQGERLFWLADSGVLDQFGFLDVSYVLLDPTQSDRPFPRTKVQEKQKATRVTAALSWEGNGSSVTRFITAAATGDMEALERIWKHYSGAMLNAARKRLSPMVRRVADEEDVAHSAFRSFCTLIGRGKVQVPDRESLWALLMTMTVRKAMKLSRHAQADKRDVRRQIDLEEIIARIPSHEPTPEFVASFQEEFDRLMEILDSAGLQDIAKYQLSGWTTREIAFQMNITEASVLRKLHRIKALWDTAHQQ
jgi:RNA polymerase sigma factor (sigma-70 family)